MKTKSLSYIKYILLVAAVLFIIIGIMGGEHGIVFKKAIRVCLECIGVG